MMAKNKIDRLSRLIKVSGLIAAGIVDAPVVGEFKKAVLGYAGTQSIGTDQALKNLYQGENELGILVRKAFAVIDDQNVRSVATGAIYPRGDRWYLDLIRDPDDIDEQVEDDDDGDIVEKGDGGAHDLAGALLRHLQDRLENRREAHGFKKSEKEKPPMESLTSILKDIGPIAVAKQIVATGRTFGISEAEYVEGASRCAVALYGLPSARAFAKLCESDGDVMRACGVLKAAEFNAARAHQGPGSTTIYPMPRGSHRATADRSENTAYNELMAKAAEYRKAHPELSESQAFAAVYTTPANIALAKRERIESATR
jgi:hypothetical protein